MYSFTHNGTVHTMPEAREIVRDIKANGGDYFYCLGLEDAMEAHRVPYREYLLNLHLDALSLELPPIGAPYRAHFQTTGYHRPTRYYDNFVDARRGVSTIAANSRVELTPGKMGYSCAEFSTVGEFADE